MEIVIISLRSIFSHKLRSILTMLGVIIGIAAIISIFSIIQGNTEYMKQQMLGGNNNTMAINYDQPARFDKGQLSAKDPKQPLYIPEVSESNIKTIKKIPNVDTFGIGYSLNQQIFFNKSGVYGNVTAATNDYIRLKEPIIVQGRKIDYDDFLNKRQVIMINEEFKKQLPTKVKVNSFIEINGYPFQLIGVYKEKRNDLLYDSEKNAMVPYGSWSNITNTLDNKPTILVKSNNINELQSTATEVAKYLNSIYPKSDFVFGIDDFDEYTHQMEELNNSNFYLLAGIASISLVVGGIGVMNIMLVSVTERTREIGVKKALGAKRKVILTQFLIEAVILTITGGGIGVILGILAGFGITFYLGYPYTLSIIAIMSSLLFCCIIGIFFGFVPAYKASKLNPIEALRFE